MTLNEKLIALNKNLLFAGWEGNKEAIATLTHKIKQIEQRIDSGE